LWLPVVVSGCASCEETPDGPATQAAPSEAPQAPPELRGRYRAVLTSPGGELPFHLVIHEAGHTPPAEALNGDERVAFTSVEVEGAEVTLGLDVYGATIVATADDEGTLRGRWRRENREGHSELPFVATPGDEATPRFAIPLEPAGAETISEVSGVWRVMFTDEDGDFAARGELNQEGAHVIGTFLTATGDYRYLEGDFQRGTLRMSTFDMSHAFLFVARATDDGGLRGDFWSRDTYHANFVATPHDPETDGAILPDPFGEVRVVSEDQKLRFDIEGPDGERVALPSDAFAGRVLVVNVFGTWCPNCNDEAPLLAELDARYRERGLSIVGLAFEHSADPEVAGPRLTHFAERHDIAYPLFVAGRSVKAETSAALPDLSEIKSYPTTIFIGRDGRVRRIHSGFAGPATGQHHQRLVAEIEALIEALLSESVPN